MNESIVRLFNLQKYDREILDREKMIAEIPQKIKELEKVLDERKELLEEITQRLRENHNKELAIDKKLQETKMNIERHKKQLLTVKTNREYAALLKEISTEESNIERLEEEMITLLDEVEGIEEEKREEEKTLSKMGEKFEKDRKTLEEKKRRFEGEIVEKREIREKIKGELKKNLLKRYEKIRSARDGIAVVTIQGENCGGCFATIPPQVINEAKKGDKIMTCESCGRILVFLEEGHGLDDG
jgi:predicted  nucleic acid-binding Zn-ribbon protein